MPLEEYIKENDEVNFPVVLLKTINEYNIVGVRIGINDHSIMLKDPISFTFGWDQDGPTISVSRMSRFTENRVLNFDRSHILFTSSASERTKYVYARARVFVYDGNPKYLDDYFKKYGDLLMKHFEDFKKYEEKSALSLTNPSEVLSEDDKASLLEKMDTKIKN